MRAREDKDRARLDAGTGPARELEALQHELVTLNRRQGELEDAELELMEQREQAQAVLDEVEQRLAAAREQAAAAEARRDEALADIDRGRGVPGQRRAQPLVADLPADLVALYEKIREQAGRGRGAAARRPLRGLPAGAVRQERARVKAAPPDEVVRCEECRRILVRTPESGL